MKRIYSTVLMLAMIIAALSLTACSSSSDDDEGGGNTSSLVGTWKVLGEESYIQFKNGGSFIDANDKDVNYGTWKVTDNTLLLNYNEDGIAFKLSIVSKSNKYLTLKALSYYYLSNPSDVFNVDGETSKLEKVDDSAIGKYLK